MEKKKYNIGLDIGTASVGWAVVECNTQKIIRKGQGNNRRALWGARLFDNADTAEKRRKFRSTRRRYDRRRNRIKLLQKEFSEEINKVDNQFFQKLKESKYCVDDKQNKTTVLSSEDKNLLKKYKTIYHLRNRLINDTTKEDIRLVYLAIHHIVKYRGNFLYNDRNFNINNLDLEANLKECFESFINVAPYLKISDNYYEIIDIKELLTQVVNPNKNDARTNVKNILINITNNSEFATEFSKSVIGNKFSVKNLLQLDDIDKNKDIIISFSNADLDDTEKLSKLEDLLGNKIEVLYSLKQLYNSIFLTKLFKGSSNKSLSALMVKNYTIHQEDLTLLKKIFRADREYKYKMNVKNPNELYNKIFKTPENSKVMCLYDNYIHNKISCEDFLNKLEKYITSILDNIKDDKILNEYSNAKLRIKNGDFLPRVTSNENGCYPYQLNEDELEKIIENQKKYYPFLSNKIGDKYKLVKLLEYKIPYYVGPLNNTTSKKGKTNPNSWMERKINNEAITPYNFDKVIDEEKTAEKFIKRMISHCTYLLNEYALPNNSILYSKFKVMNELKQIKVNGEKLENIKKGLTNEILENLFKKTNGSITDKKFKEYLYQLNELDMYEGDINVTGYSSDGKFANNMQSYFDFFGNEGIFNGTSYNEENADEIIEWITIFDEKDILKRKVKTTYSELNDTQVDKILSRKYSGWGKLSKKLLTDLYITDKESGIVKNIMTLMYETDENFMQIINNDEYKFQDLIRDNNVINDKPKISYDLVKELATSPATKKGIYQALKVVEEIVDYMGYEPENIMIEMARGGNNKKERKDDKKKYLLNLYEKAKEITDEYNKLYSEIDKTEKIENDKVYLYYLQEAKCMYCGKSIDIEDLNGAEYEIDHILPRTLIKDNSWYNRVLVCRCHNQDKGADLVLPKRFRNDYTRKIWDRLRKNGLMSATKHYRLTRREYSNEDIQGFINRQLVETRQITKHVANILNNFYKDTKIVYLKANLSHNYREKYELFKFREINDFHHAHDAYLVAVLGEYKEKYMQKNIVFEMVQEMNSKLKKLGKYKDLKYEFVINSLDESVNDIVVNVYKKLVDKNTSKFDVKKFNAQIEKTLYRNDILICRKTEIKTGKFYDQTIHSPKDSKIKSGVPLKKNMPTEKYGFKTSEKPSYLILANIDSKQYLLSIPIYLSKTLKVEDYISELFKVPIEKITIIKNKIPFGVSYNYKGQNVLISGSSELTNNTQLKLPKELAKKWKHVLNYIFNDVEIPILNNEPIISECNLEKNLDEIIKYLLTLKNIYPLFKEKLNIIEEKKQIFNLNIIEKKNAIKNIVIMLSANKNNANLKNVGLTDREGRLRYSRIEHGVIINKSVTGIKESKYEF